MIIQSIILSVRRGEIHRSRNKQVSKNTRFAGWAEDN